MTKYHKNPHLIACKAPAETPFQVAILTRVTLRSKHADELLYVECELLNIEAPSNAVRVDPSEPISIQHFLKRRQ